MLLRGKNRKGKLTYKSNRKMKEKIRDWNKVASAKKRAKVCIGCLKNDDGFCKKNNQWCYNVNDNCSDRENC